MGGPRLTPEEVEIASEVYARTSDTSAAAAAIHRNESTLRAFFERVRIARNRDLHARACEDGLREGLGFLMDVARDCHGVLTRRTTTPSGLEASDFAALGRAVNQAIATVAALAERDEKRRQARLTRQKTRGDIAKVAADTVKVKAETRALEREVAPNVEQLVAAIAALSRDDKLRLRDALRPPAPEAPAPAPAEGT